MNYIFLLAALFFFAKGTKVPEFDEFDEFNASDHSQTPKHPNTQTPKLRHLGLSVLCGGMTAYSYPFFSSFLYAFLGTGILLSLLLKDRRGFWRYGVVLTLNLVLLAPFLYWIFSFSDSALQQTHIMNRSHQPVLTAQVMFTLGLGGLIVGLLVKGILNIHTGIIAGALLVSGVICINQQILTGVYVQAGHYLLYVIPQAIILALTLLVAALLQTSPGRRLQRLLQPLPLKPLLLWGGILLGSVGIITTPSLVAAYVSPDGVLTPKIHGVLDILHWGGSLLGLGLLACWGFGRKSAFLKQRLFPVGGMLGGLLLGYLFLDIGMVQYERYYAYVKPNFGYLQQLAPAVRWLNLNTPPGSVVLGALDYASTDTVIPVYTHDYVYMAAHAQYYPIPAPAEMRDRIYNVMALMGIRSSADFEAFLSEKESIAGPLFLGYSHPSFAEYQEKLRKPLYSELKKYRVDYLFYGPREQKGFRVDPETTYAFLRKVYDDGIVKIYQVI